MKREGLPEMAPCRLRPLTEDDVPMLFAWRNHPDVRRFMYTQHEISVQEHSDYFARALRDTTRAYYLGLDDEEPVGVVSLRDIDRDHGTASWGFYVRPRGPRGTGRRMLSRRSMRRSFDMVWPSSSDPGLQSSVDQAASGPGIRNRGCPSRSTLVWRATTRRGAHGHARVSLDGGTQGLDRASR